jgi:hypothetical protein
LHRLVKPLKVVAMSDTAKLTVFGTGGHGRLYPELPEEKRAAIIERFNANTRTFFPGVMGFRVVDVRQGYARLADTAVAAALNTIYGAGNLLLTIEMKINYLEPIPPGEVIAEAYILRSSRRSAYAEVDLWSGGKLAGRASTTYMIKPPAEPGRSGVPS